MNDHIIQFKKVSKRFQISNHEIPALRGINLDIKKGSILGIIGRSGAGKSTLLRCINALEKPDTGEIFYDGINITQSEHKNLRKIRHDIGIIFQHFNLLSRRTVLENVALPLEILGWNKTRILEKAKESLKRVGLVDKEHAYPSELSGGQKQRVAIARALASQAKVLLSDEATSALDPEATAEILQLIKKLNKELNLTVILITHEIQVIRDICHDVCVMDKGSIVEHTSAETLFSNPRHPVSRSFIDSIISSDVPEIIKKDLQPKGQEDTFDVVLRLLFAAGVADKPIVSQFIKEHATEVNILSGHLDHIGSSNFGTLVVSLKNNQKELSKATEFLKSRNVSIETLGYLPRS